MLPKIRTSGLTRKRTGDERQNEKQKGVAHCGVRLKSESVPVILSGDGARVCDPQQALKLAGARPGKSRYRENDWGMVAPRAALRWPGTVLFRPKTSQVLVKRSITLTDQAVFGADRGICPFARAVYRSDRQGYSPNRVVL